MTTILLLLAALCPPDAGASSAIVTVGIFPPTVYAGQPVIVSARLLYVPQIPNRTEINIAFSGGTLTMTIGPNTYDMTPTNGIPLLGPPSCAPTDLLVRPLPHTFCEPGQHLVTVNYRNENGPFGPIHASSTRVVRVECQSPMHITKQGDNVLVRWYGYGRYSLEASEDLRGWTDVGVVGTGDECEDLSMTVPSGVGMQFFRYKRIQ